MLALSKFYNLNFEPIYNKIKYDEINYKILARKLYLTFSVVYRIPIKSATFDVWGTTYQDMALYEILGVYNEPM